MGFLHLAYAPIRTAILAAAITVPTLFGMNLAGILSPAAAQSVDWWKSEWPNTDFSLHSIEFSEILSGGPPKDGIPSIDRPKFVSVASVSDLAPTEPVVGLTVNGEARAYPLRILTWHEIVNDTIGGKPVTVTYCPLCNSAIVFDREVDGKILEFGTTGKLRNSDLVMYDRTTESWWQQFLGEAIVGEMTGTKLRMLPSRLESWERFAARNPDGQVLVPNDEGMRSYGRNPYDGYDTSAVPFLYRGEMPEGIEPMARVVAVGKKAWSMNLLRAGGKIESDDLVLTWEAGQNSALDSSTISKGRDVGNVIVQRLENGTMVDVPYDVTFAFVFHAFHPEGELRIE
ncbi:DUF3179 domain-containing protein [Pelagibius sp. Alg239-R121]|uniref:DUF3179 domain-containing protein n=1 Tax=Pelagibius sp. Alg239-R121 TaxID=2993448 RepID=UPI0024A69BF3|nr:DUF3179 domain-containing protein [Pelagibius sp. Alg239-R121]